CALEAGTAAVGRTARDGALRPAITTTLLTSLPVRWSAFTTLTMRSAVPPVAADAATAAIAGAKARIKRKHRKMF
ncbi:MAG: hypothetical protein WA015_10435, partial [Bryobacteraceae bacterium]